MKHIIRRPLLPCLLMAVLIFGGCFMTLFQQNIIDDQATVDEMYRNIQLTFQVLPGTSANGVLQLRNSPASAIRAMDEVTDCAYYLSCPYSVRQPRALPNLSNIYGTNDLDFFAAERGVLITYGEGWDAQRVLSPTEDGIPCLLEVNIAAVLGVQTGDTFVIAPNVGTNEDAGSAPALTMIAAGTYADTAGLTDLYGLIVSDAVFASNPGLLYNSDMMLYHYYYRTFHFQTDPAYNREFERIRDEIKAILEEEGDFILYSNVRTLEQAVRPIEQKLRIQQMLVIPLSVVFCVAAAVAALLLSLSFGSEVFLRLMWGEKRSLVFLKMMCSICVVLLCTVGLAVMAVSIISGGAWIGWAVKYLAAACGLCFVAAAVPQFINCSKNLVIFYQSREG